MSDCLGDDTIAAYVDGSLELDNVLRIDHHIDHCKTCRTQLSAVAASPVMHSFVSDVAGSSPAAEVVEAIAHGRPGDPLPELAIGRYVVEEVIGRGGMGVVVRARDPELERAVAIKLVDPAATQRTPMDSSSGEWRARLRSEARAMARLRHPNVVTVFDTGAVGNQLFVAMELVDGESLARRLVRDRTDALALCIAAGRGLCAAHAAGLVHGDVKPDNILVDRDGRSQIGDFGLTRAIAECSTTAGAVVGTPAYMAPELLRGQPADPRSDQFAFAVTVYEAVTSRRPWRAETLDALADAIAHDQLARPPAMSRAVWRVVARGLAVDPRARYPSMPSFVDALERAARPIWLRRGWLIGASSLAMVGVALGTFALSSRAAGLACADPIDRGARMAAGPSCGPAASLPCSSLVAALASRAATWRRTYVGVCRATQDGRQSAELLDRRMRCLDDRELEQTALIGQLASPLVRAEAFDAIAVVHHLDAPEHCATFDRRVAPVPPAKAAAIAEAKRWVAAAQADYNLGHYQAGRAALAPHLDAIRALAHLPLVAKAADLLGELQRLSGDLDGAERSYDLGLQAAAEAGDDVETATLLLERAYLLGECRQQWSRAGELLRAAEAAVVRAGRTPALASWLLLEQGTMAESTGDFEAARTDFRKAVELRRASADPSDPSEMAVALQALCRSDDEAGKLDEARKHCEEAVRVLRGDLGDTHPVVAEAENQLGVAIAISGDLPSARAHWETALATLERGLGEDAEGLAAVLLNLAQASRLLGDIAVADRYLARARKAANGNASAESIATQIRIADQLHASGKLEDGITVLEDLARRAEATLGSRDATSAHAVAVLAAAYRDAHRDAETRAAFAKAVTMATAVYGPRHPSTINVIEQYGVALMTMNDARAAQPMLQQALAFLEATDPADSPQLGEAYTNLAECSIHLDAAAAAVEPARKGLAIEEQRGDDPLQTAEARFVLARALWRARRDPGAVAMARKARDEMRAIGARATTLPEIQRWLAGQR